MHNYKSMPLNKQGYRKEILNPFSEQLRKHLEKEKDKAKTEKKYRIVHSDQSG